MTHVHADHDAAIPDFFRQREEAGIESPLSIITSHYSRSLYPPLAFQSAFIHDEDRKRKSKVISETHQELLTILGTWKASFNDPRHFDKHKRHRGNHKKSDFIKSETLRNTVLQEHNREIGEQLFLAKINFVFGSKESRFFDLEIKLIIDELI